MADTPLYWIHPDITECTAPVVSAEPESGSGDAVWRLKLDAAPFYPGGGGQPADRGSIAGFPLLSIEKESGAAIHRVAAPGPFVPGDRVDCRLDAGFRRDSMQQHTGQHLVSAALAAEGLETVSVHLGSDYCGIEVNAGAVSDEAVRRAEDRCAAWIRENRPVASRLVSAADATDLSLRRPLSGRASDSAGPVRLVEIEGIDTVGCGGVHLGNTASIQAVLYDGFEKMHGRIRLKWIIGERVVDRARSLTGIADELRRMLSAEYGELPGRLDALIRDGRRLAGELEKTEGELGRRIAASEAADVGAAEFVAASVGGGTARIAGALDEAGHLGRTAAFFVGAADDEDRRPWGLRLTEAAPFDFNGFRGSVLSCFEGRGGGRQPVFRGILSGKDEDILAAVRRMVECNSAK